MTDLEKQYHIRGLTLRQLDEHDRPAMVALLNRVLAALPDPRWYFGTTDQEFDEWLQYREAFGYFHGDELCGYGVLIPASRRGEEHSYAVKLGEDPANTFDFTDIAVSPDYRRRGIHANLAALFSEMARAMGGKAIYCTVDPENVPSRRSFEHAGFEAVLEREMYDGRPRVFYKKTLA